ncbi:MAG: hypothetical protein IKQ35_04540 [Bacilli bacterium]|nr:hypothetical protein [Bacilli bacterium]
MSKKQLVADIVFFLGLIIFAVAFIISIVNSDVNPLLIDGIMALGLVVEFVGLCLTYKFDKSGNDNDTKTREEKVLEQEKKTKVEDVVENVVEAEVEEPVVEEVKEVKETKTTTKKATPKKKTTTKKTTTKKGTTTKKKTTGTKKTTTKKKSSTKKGK